MILPLDVTAKTSSDSPTTRAPTTDPRLSVTRIPRTPRPPRPFTENSLGSVRLPNPSVVRCKTMASGLTTTHDTRKSLSRNRMPLTPAALRPMARTSSSLIRSVWP